MGLLVAHAFGAMRMPRLTATTDAENVSAHKLLKALGFRREAVRDVMFKGKQGKELDFASSARSSKQ